MYRILPPPLTWLQCLHIIWLYLREPSAKSLSSNIAKAWEAYFDHAICIPFASGRAALVAILQLATPVSKKKVVVPSFVCSAVIAAIQAAGKHPIFVDISKDLTMNPDSLAQSIDKNVAAVIMPHVYGKVCNWRAIKKITDLHNCILIDDAAPCAGLSYAGGILGTLGDYGIASMNYKAISACHGGMLIVPDNKAINFDTLLHNVTAYNFASTVALNELLTFFISGLLPHSSFYKLIKKLNIKQNRCLEPINEEIELKNISKISATLGLYQINSMLSLQRRREKNAYALKQSLYGLSWVQVMKAQEKDFFIRFVIRVDDKIDIEKLKKFLWLKNIQTFSAYTPAHILLKSDSHLPKTEEAYKSLLILPHNPIYGEKDMDFIGTTLRQFKA